MLVIKSFIENKVEDHQNNEKKTKEAKVKAVLENPRGAKITNPRENHKQKPPI
jgi:hypothetical protein